MIALHLSQDMLLTVVITTRSEDEKTRTGSPVKDKLVKYLSTTIIRIGGL